MLCHSVPRTHLSVPVASMQLPADPVEAAEGWLCSAGTCSHERHCAWYHSQASACWQAIFGAAIDELNGLGDLVVLGCELLPSLLQGGLMEPAVYGKFTLGFLAPVCLVSYGCTFCQHACHLSLHV